jgi:benzoate/toluate 1,2-dioxygenase alpha subunit
VPTLDDYLGPTKKYIDLWADLSPKGTFTVREPHKFLVASNWKFQMENTNDGYHARFVHESAFNTLKHSYGDSAKDYSGGFQVGRAIGLPHGHSMMERPGMTSMKPDIHKVYREHLAQAYGAERADHILYGRNLTIFPNLALLENNIRVVHPITVDRTELYSYYFEYDGVPDEVNADSLRDSQWRRGSMGFINSDDVEMFASNQAGTGVRSLEWLLLSKGIEDETVSPDGERLGGHIHDEICTRSIYREWIRLMDAVQ